MEEGETDLVEFGRERDITNAVMHLLGISVIMVGGFIVLVVIMHITRCPRIVLGFACYVISPFGE